ncbi:MAG: hypothetical protein RLZZ227_1147 [Pseudomonadota bacterium]|jgi:hypothetical protein
MKLRDLSTLLLSASLSVPLCAQTSLDVAQYNDAGELQRPANLVEWIQTGASLGSEYSELPFDAAKPGSLGVVQIEPAAYRYFVENGTYADGTMFLLSFYRAEAQSAPQLPGFVQGDMFLQEIHVIDKARFADDSGHAFFTFAAPEVMTSERIAAGNECTACHLEHGAFDGSFTQFYPLMRARLARD